MAMDTELGNAACSEYEALLEDYLNDELNAADAKRASEHWKNCAGCRAALEQAAESARLLRLAEPSADPGPAFARIVMARIRAAEQDRGVLWQPFVSLAWRVAATASLALALLVTYDAGWGHRPQPNADSTRLTGVSDLFSPDPANLPANGDEVLMMVAESNHGN